MYCTDIITRNATKPNFVFKTLRQVLEMKKQTNPDFFKFFCLYYGKSVILRLFGIGFSTQMKRNMLLLKIGFSIPIQVQIPTNIKAYIKEDERKKKNIIYFFSTNIPSVNSFIKIVQKHKPLSVFVRKRITGILRLNELSTFKFKKWKDKKKKRK